MTISLVNRTKKQARHAYTKLSRFYDWFTSAEAPFKRAGLELLATQPGETVLEIGFGTGESLLALANAAGANGHVCGVDLSAGMAAVARQKLRAADVFSRTSMFLGDGATLSMKAGAFDAVFISFTLELFDTPEIPHVLAEIRRVLKPDGRLAVVAMAKKPHDSPMVQLYEWAHRRFTVWVDCRPIFARAMVEAAGFRVQTVQAVSMFGLPVEIIRAVAPLS